MNSPFNSLFVLSSCVRFFHSWTILFLIIPNCSWFDPFVVSGWSKPLVQEDLWSLDPEYTYSGIMHKECQVFMFIVYIYIDQSQINKRNSFPSFFLFILFGDTLVRLAIQIGLFFSFCSRRDPLFIEWYVWFTRYLLNLSWSMMIEILLFFYLQADHLYLWFGDKCCRYNGGNCENFSPI